MTNQLQVFKFRENEVRVAVIDGEPWWVALDVCNVLEHSNSRMALERLDDDEKGVSSIYTPGGNQAMAVVNEPGLYTLVLGSRKPEAREFKRWITHDVIPAIRKHGMYFTHATAEALMNDPRALAQVFLALADERDARHVAEAKCETLETKIEEDRPLVEFANVVGDTADLITVSQMAKLLNSKEIPMGQKRLFAWLRDVGLLRFNNEPYQQYVDQGYFHVREVLRQTAFGIRSYTQTMITGKGQIYITERLRREMIATA